MMPLKPHFYKRGDRWICHVRTVRGDYFEMARDFRVAWRLIEGRWRDRYVVKA